MSTYNRGSDSRTARARASQWAEKSHHTKEDALSTREWELLLEGAAALDQPYKIEATTVVYLGGRLGLRPGEVAHLRTDWIDWREEIIQIPRHEPCEKGRDGGPCGYCRRRANERVEHADGTITMDEALRERWHPKTRNSAREVPFGFSERIRICLERFDDRYHGFPRCRQAVNRRLNRAAEAAVELSADDVYPHALRATAATYHTGRGLGALQLQSLMGWEEISTAMKYVQKSGERTARALDRVHNGS